MNKKKLVVSHGGVKIYHSWKGARPLTYWYALTPNYNAEGDQDLDFDIRELPADYWRGLTLVEPIRDGEAFDRVMEAHRQALKRAIDGGHDFLAGHKRRRPSEKPLVTTGLVGLFWRWIERLGRSTR